MYANYESDAHGEFDILVGAEEVDKSEGRESIDLEEGTYLCFVAKGELPQAVIETWCEIWNYFADVNCAEKRAYKTDFELYLSQNEAEIYIGVK